MDAIILAAGIGTRFGCPYPKVLTKLDTGQSIMQHQINGLQRHVELHSIYVVVGFEKELIMEAFPELIFIYNDRFDTTNTSKSLLQGLQKTQRHRCDVLWINGDVVFDHRVIARIKNFSGSCMAVNTGPVGDEEVKYLTSDNGAISKVSKTVTGGVGEALGVNKIAGKDIGVLMKHLQQCDDFDYFERGIETAIANGLRIFPVDVSDLLCTEVDFPEDLQRVNKELICH
jgi:choline kinase